MRKRKIQNRKRVNVTYEMETYKALEKIAEEREISIPEVIREYTEQGLKGDNLIENMDIIANIIREQLKLILDPAVNRLAALSSKASIQSATAAYLTAETINKFVPEEYREEYYDVYQKARKKGVEYVRGKSVE